MSVWAVGRGRRVDKKYKEAVPGSSLRNSLATREKNYISLRAVNVDGYARIKPDVITNRTTTTTATHTVIR